MASEFRFYADDRASTLLYYQREVSGETAFEMYPSTNKPATHFLVKELR